MASPEYAGCLAYLKQGAALDVAVCRSWFDVRKGGTIFKSDSASTDVTIAPCNHAQVHVQSLPAEVFAV